MNDTSHQPTQQPKCSSNPFARHQARMRRLLFEVITVDRLTAILEQLATMAQEGSIPAMKLLLSYTLGKPEKQVDPDTVDLQELNQATRTAAAIAPALSTAGSMTAAETLETMRHLKADADRREEEIYAPNHDSQRPGAESKRKNRRARAQKFVNLLRAAGLPGRNGS